MCICVALGTSIRILLNFSASTLSKSAYRFPLLKERSEGKAFERKEDKGKTKKKKEEVVPKILERLVGQLKAKVSLLRQLML